MFIVLDYSQGKDTAGRWAETLLVAYKTLGVVFGGLVTSPLYVYSSILPLKSPTIDEYFGIYSIMFWTLTLIGVVKYATIALRADDDGEGDYAKRFLNFCARTRARAHIYIVCMMHTASELDSESLTTSACGI